MNFMSALLRCGAAPVGKGKCASIRRMNAVTEDQALYPPIEPFASGMLDVGDGHRMYFEQCGVPDGLPVVFLHGGPGSGCVARHRRFFDPARYRIVLFDQRGCGRSTPRGELKHNTSAHLLADIERLRTHLGIERWLVFGGSWGASLGLAYCAAHKASCSGAILRGVFLTGRRDVAWFFDEAGQLLPDAWQRLADHAPKRRRRDLLAWYVKQISGEDRDAALAAVAQWMRWEESLTQPGRAPPALPTPAGDEVQRLIDKYRLQGHYLMRECFLGDKRLLDCAAQMHGLPTAILHGRLDFICRPEAAWRVHHTLHGSRLRLVDGAGHSPFDPPMARALVEATDHFLSHREFSGWGGSAHDKRAE